MRRRCGLLRLRLMLVDGFWTLGDQELDQRRLQRRGVGRVPERGEEQQGVQADAQSEGLAPETYRSPLIALRRRSSRAAFAPGGISVTKARSAIAMVAV